MGVTHISGDSHRIHVPVAVMQCKHIISAKAFDFWTRTKSHVLFISFSSGMKTQSISLHSENEINNSYNVSKLVPID